MKLWSPKLWPPKFWVFAHRSAVLDAVFAEEGAGLAQLNATGHVERANQIFLAMTGVKVGQQMFSVVPPPAGPRLRDALTHARAATLITDLALGEARRAVALTITPISNHDGAMILITDRSGEQALAEQLGQAQRLQAVGQLAAGVAHDMNNLLTAIQTAAEESLDRISATLDRRNLEQIIDQVHRGAAMTRQLLAFGGEQTMIPKTVGLNHAISSVAPLVARLLGPGVRVEFSLDETERSLRIDPTQFDQVMMNLAVNARHAMHGEGKVRIATGRQLILHPTQIGPSLVPPGRYLTISFSDSGCGMKPEILARIFEPFFSTRRQAGGTGLGLSTVLGIVAQSGGFINVQSTPGEGTIFSILFPRDESVPPVVAAPVEISMPLPKSMVSASQKGLVLLVEDEAPVRKLAERALLRAGFAVMACETAEEAIEKFTPHTACVVSDVTLPGLDGVSLVEKLRITRGNLPAILMSGYADQTRRAQLAQAHMVFLAKPFALKDLVKTVQQTASLTPQTAE